MHNVTTYITSSNASSDVYSKASALSGDNRDGLMIVFPNLSYNSS